MQAIGGEIHQRRSVSQGSEFVGGEKAAPCESGFRSKDAIEFRGVAARFMDLQRELRAAQNKRGLAARTDIGSEQGHRFGCNPLGIVGKLLIDDVLPSGGSLTAEGIGIESAPESHRR